MALKPSQKIKNITALCEYLGITDLVVEVLRYRLERDRTWR